MENQLAARIATAFPPGAPPVEVVSLLARELHAHAADIENALDGQAWQEVPTDVLEDQAKNILALSPEAFAYYLPAFLRAALREPGGDSATYAMYALSPLGNLENYAQTTCTLFSPDQAGVIVEFLNILMEDPSFAPLAHELPSAIDLWQRRASAL